MSLSDILRINDWLKQKHPSRNLYGEKLDSNGYSSSLFNCEDGICFICGAHTDTARHELFRGNNRRISKAVGLYITVCPRCHEVAHRSEDEWHKAGQRMFEHYHSHEEFIAYFGENYV